MVLVFSWLMSRLWQNSLQVYALMPDIGGALIGLTSLLQDPPDLKLPTIPAGIITALINWVVKIISAGIVLFLAWDIGSELLGRRDMKKIVMEVAGGMIALSVMVNSLSIINAILTLFNLTTVS